MEDNKDMITEEEQLQDGLVVLIDEEGVERTFEVIERVELNGQEYAILAPWEEEDDDSAIPLKIVVENGEELLYDIDDDAEWEAIVEFWNAYVDGQDEE